MSLHHVNFHTLYNNHLFADDRHDQMMRRCLIDVLRERGILCPVWELMPNHVHMVVDDFPDLSLATIMQFVKGDTSRAFFRAFPEMRADLLGGHLWRPGYYTAHIVTHRQYLATVAYIHDNRARADLLPPVPLAPVGVASSAQAPRSGDRAT